MKDINNLATGKKKNPEGRYKTWGNLKEYRNNLVDMKLMAPTKASGSKVDTAITALDKKINEIKPTIDLVRPFVDDAIKNGKSKEWVAENFSQTGYPTELLKDAQTYYDKQEKRIETKDAATALRENEILDMIGNEGLTSEKSTKIVKNLAKLAKYDKGIHSTVKQWTKDSGSWFGDPLSSGMFGIAENDPRGEQLYASIMANSRLKKTFMTVAKEAGYTKEDIENDKTDIFREIFGSMTPEQFEEAYQKTKG